MINNIFYKDYDYIDLHGYDMQMAQVATNDFIKESIILGRRNIIIIHGKGMGLVKKSVYEVLEKNKYVLKFYQDVFNDGITIVELKIEKS